MLICVRCCLLRLFWGFFHDFKCCELSAIVSDYVLGTLNELKNKEGVLVTNQDEIQKRWKEHFLEVLNRPAPEDAGEFG